MLRKLILGFALAWAGVAFLQEVNGAVRSFDARETRAAGPMYWRFGIPQMTGFARCVAAAHREIPAGSVVAFASRPGPDAADFFRWRWAAYLLPEMHVVPLSDAEASRMADYLLTFRLESDDPRFEPLRRLPGGWLYRARRS